MGEDSIADDEDERTPVEGPVTGADEGDAADDPKAVPGYQQQPPPGYPPPRPE